MRQRHITIATRTGSPRTKRFVIGSLGVVLTVTATSGLAVAGSSPNQSVQTNHLSSSLPKETRRQIEPAATSVSSSDDRAGSAIRDNALTNTTTASTNSATTVSINGETIQVNGDGSYDRVYQTNNGTTNIDVSVRHSSSGISSSSTSVTTNVNSEEVDME